jgi:YopX protein
MREIKFRAWDKETKMMCRVLSFLFPQRERATATLMPYEGPYITCYLDEIELIQPTGLHDKYGKEIWEGDILKCYDGLSRSYYNSEVKWQVREITHEAKIIPWIVGLMVSGFIIGSVSEVEVIGNIYENPELML